MIVAKTKMRKMPKNCRDCKLSFSTWVGDRFCFIMNNKDCPKEYEKNGSWKYVRPDWCPLMEMEVNHDE